MSFLAAGYVLGSVTSSSDAATGTSTAVQLGSLFASGFALPFVFLPKGVVAVLPTTCAADLLVGAIPTLNAQHTAAISALVVTGSAVAVFCLAAWKFRWNGRDD